MIKLDDNDKSIVAILNEKNKLVKYVGASDSHENLYKEIELEKDFKFQVIPRKGKERDIIFVTGESGSGKSTYCSKYVEQYIKEYPKNEIFLISFLPHDDVLDKIKKLKRLDVFNDEFMSEIENISINDFENSLIIFDDVDSVPLKKTKQKLYSLINQILRLGRHSKTSLVFCGHELFLRDETKSLLNESSHIVYFPRTIGTGKLERLLKVYLGFNKEQIKTINEITDTRSITILKGYPKIIIADHLIYHL